MPHDGAIAAVRFTRYPVISLGAEYLVMGSLMRRNILTYKAPPNHEGYDLICIHSDSRTTVRPVRIQVKSRLATDCDRGFPVKERTFGAFDYLIVAFLNVGYFFKKRAGATTCQDGARDPEFYTFPVHFIRQHHNASSSWEKVRTRGLDIERYKNERGFEQIAERLRIACPEKVGRPTPARQPTGPAETESPG
ncbi:MAG TPA: hypothetical protein VKD90_04415 [Gemmataceae bacterium]|nr:hypothetical protein [Gemmataceae bacterium]